MNVALYSNLQPGHECASGWSSVSEALLDSDSSEFTLNEDYEKCNYDHAKDIGTLYIATLMPPHQSCPQSFWGRKTARRRLRHMRKLLNGFSIALCILQRVLVFIT